MAANLATMSDGRVAMAAWGRIPVWHRTGQRSDDLMTVPEAYELSGTDYLVEACPAMFLGGNGQPCEGHGVQLVRTDTQKALGSASEWYRTIQNRDVFGLLDPMIGNGLAGIMTAGVIGNGEKAWMQAVIGEIGVDKVDRGIATLLCTNDHTANGAASVGFNTVWVVCANTERAAQHQWDGTGNVRRVVHSGDTKGNLEIVRNSLDLAEKRFRAWEEVATELTRVKLEDPRHIWRLALASVFPPDKTIQSWKENPNTNKSYFKNIWKAIVGEYASGLGSDLPSRRQTAWGAYNAVTGWVDHHRLATKTPDERTKQAWYGAGAEIKDRALTVTLDHLRDGKPWSELLEEVEALVN